MRDLVVKLPDVNQQSRDPYTSDATIGAVLGICWEIVKSNLELTKALHENGGTDRLRSLAKSFPVYSKRVCKYATQVLFLMWQHKDMQEAFRRVGLRDEDFYSGTIGKKGGRGAMPSVDTATLRRPISSMGNERPANLRSETGNESMDSVRHGQYDSPSVWISKTYIFYSFSLDWESLKCQICWILSGHSHQWAFDISKSSTTFCQTSGWFKYPFRFEIT